MKKTNLAIVFGTALLLAGCAASPDYGYGYGYANNGYGSCGWGGYCNDSYGPYAYGAGPSFGLDLNFSDRDRGDRDRREAFRTPEAARAGSSGAHEQRQIGRSAPAARSQASGAPVRRQGGDHGGEHGQDHDRDR